MTNCPNCGAPISAGSAVCGECDFPIGSLPDPPPYPPRSERFGSRLAAALTPGKKPDQGEKPKRNDAAILVTALAIVLAVALVGGVAFFFAGRAAAGRDSKANPTLTQTPSFNDPSQTDEPAPLPSTPGANPTRRPTRTPSPSTSTTPTGPTNPFSTSPDLVAAKAAQALNLGQRDIFISVAVDEAAGGQIYDLMTGELGRPGWESGECRRVGPVFLCKMFKSGADGGELILQLDGRGVLITGWSAPPR